ncbi:TPA: Jag N-terminal domain-containing protein, partial [Streptococcus pyogenes]|nr:Jag N-terminal domain-containing protein [Streptococcus pyogenes]HER2423792.1 Jag N-terminal domain-containing protein [Streptococcus pyogenes]
MVLFTGKTVEEAIETGLQELGLSRLKAHIKVISKEKKGFLGFGKKPAQVDIEGISDKTVYKADKKATRGVPEDIN